MKILSLVGVAKLAVLCILAPSWSSKNHNDNKVVGVAEGFGRTAVPSARGRALSLLDSSSSLTRRRRPWTTAPHSPVADRRTSLHMMLDVTVAQASVAATAKLLTSIALGGAAAAKPGLLDAAAISALSRLTYWMFQPAFLFCSVSRTLHSATAAGGGLSLRALWLMPALAVAQIVMGTAAGQVLSRLFGVKDAAESANVRMCCTFGNSGPLPLIFADALFGSNPTLQSHVAAGISFYLLAWSPLFWTAGKVILGTDEKQDGDASGGGAVDRTVATIRKILSPPVIGSLAGLVVGLVEPLRHALLGQNGWLRPLYGALNTLGTAYLPAALLVLAGSLVGKKASSSSTNGETTTRTSSSPSARGLGVIACSRFLVSPALSWTVARVFIQGATWMDGRTAAIVTFLCLMEGCMPPAQNSVILLQLAGKTDAAAGMAKLLTLLYTAAVVPVTILLTACLSQSGILAFL